MGKHKKSEMKRKANKTENGMLYLVATPIGNLEDITLRAVRILKEVDLIAAEDTRETIKLMNHFGIQKPLTSYHEHNKNVKGAQLIEQMLKGKNVALTTDAGTPGISDPGGELIRAAIDSGINVTMIPGPSAVVVGTVLSGLDAGRFAFEGFVPVAKKQREQRLQSLKDEERTMAFYEAPHRLVRTLKDLRDVFGGDRNIAIARELTKQHEEVIRCTLDEAIQRYETYYDPRGEYVLVVQGKSSEEKTKQGRDWRDTSIKQHVDMYIQSGFAKKEAMKKAAEDRGTSKREIYSRYINE